MKKILMLCAILSSIAFSQEFEQKEQNINLIKEKMIEINQKRINLIQEENICLKNATSKESIKKCKKIKKEKISELKMDHFKK